MPVKRNSLHFQLRNGPHSPPALLSKQATVPANDVVMIIDLSSLASADCGRIVQDNRKCGNAMSTAIEGSKSLDFDVRSRVRTCRPEHYISHKSGGEEKSRVTSKSQK